MLAIVTSQNCYLYEKPGAPDGTNHSEITDEIFSGWAVRIVREDTGNHAADVPETQKESQANAASSSWLHVVTHYGYDGYVLAALLKIISKQELIERQDRKNFRMIGQAAADVLPGPEVESGLLETLVKNSIVEIVRDPVHNNGMNAPAAGWTLVRTAAGNVGYVHSVFLTDRADDDEFLLAGDHTDPEAVILPCTDDFSKPAYIASGAESLFNRKAREVIASRPEEELRDILTETARSYLGTQYRWAGKSSLGIDCSGLTFMCYRQIGVLIYRDAWIRAEYPVREITKEQLRPGDLIFFEGHVAMSLGGETFIHSTGFDATPGVTINSLDPKSPLYREDLPGRLLWYGSIFEGEQVTKTQEDEDRIMAERRSRAAVQCARENACLQSIAQRIHALSGNVSFYYKNLETGRTFGVDEEIPHVAASVIKLYLMSAIFDGFERELFRPDHKISVPQEAKVPSCGVLTYLSGIETMSLQDLTELMIIVSDNTATNLLWDFYESRFGEGSLNCFVRRLPGLSNTQMNRKMFDTQRSLQGIENYTSAADVGNILEAIYKGTLVSENASRRMLRMLENQRLNGKIPARLHTLSCAPQIAHKTGEDDGITHDVAIVEGERPMILCFMGSKTDVPALERLMADAAAELYLC